MAFFDILSIYNNPYDFLGVSKTVFKTFLEAQLGPILEGGASDAPPTLQKVVKN